MKSAEIKFEYAENLNPYEKVVKKGIADDLLKSLQELIHADCHSVRNSTVHIEALKNATAAISKALGEE